ncbi:hypothetical protein BC828DRAFT_294803 [Blastocladiella britannica]|nr:hypothetical protein BC828DRAFT_294803 [Blastocladiella britannica]
MSSCPPPRPLILWMESQCNHLPTSRVLRRYYCARGALYIITIFAKADMCLNTSRRALALLLDHAAKDPHLAFLVESARQPDNSEKRRQAITVLQLMAKREVNRPTMIAAKVPELCCELLCQVPIDTDVERRDPVALKEAAVALYELMCQENALKNRLVHNSSLLLGISRIMTTEWHRELTSWAIFLLHNLAMSETLQRHLADHGALPMLGDALRTVYGNWTLQKLCFHALVRIIGSLDVPATQAAVARHLTPINIVGLMASALRSDDVELGYWSLGLIHECVLKDAGRAAIRSCPGLVRVISHKLDVADVGAAKLALRVLKFLGLRDPAFHAELIDTCGDIVPRVMALAGVREPSANGDTSPSENGSDECAYWATMLIHDLVSVPAGAAAALKHKDLPKLLAMAESNRTLVPMYVVDVVAALCSLPSLSATSLIRKYPALLAAVSTLARHSDPDVAANALACMYRLAMLSPAAVLAALRAYGAELSIATTMLDGGSADRIVEGNAGRTRIDVVGAKLIAMFVMAPIEHPVPSSSSNSDIARVLADSQIEQLDPDEIVEWIVDHILQPYVLGVVMGASHTVVSTISSASLGAPHAAGGDENDRVAGSSPVKGSFGQFGWSTAAEPSSAPTSATSNPTSPVFATQHEDPTLEDGDEHEHDHGMDSATGSPRSPLLGNNVNNGEGGVPLNIGLFINTGMPGAGPAETPHPTPISAPVSSNGSHRNVDISSPQVSAPTSAQSQDLARSASMMLLTHSSDRIDGALQAIEILSGFPRIMSTIFDRHMDIVEIFIDSVFDLVMLPLVTENMELKHDRPWIRGERGMDPMGALMAAQEEAVADLQEPFHGLKLAVAGQAMSALASLFQYEVIQQYLIEERFISTAIACLRMHPKTLASPVLTALARAAQHLSRNTILATPWLLDVCRLALAQSTDLHSPYASPSAQFAAAYILDRATNATPWIGHGDFIGMSRMDKSNGLMVSSSGTEVWNLSWAFESVRATHGACAGGRWMFEVDLYAPDLLQLGWATIDCTFDMTCGRGIGDDDHSYAFDGERSRVWHGASVHNEGIEYGRKWAAGDTVGCCIDLEEGVISFMLNGEDLGIAFEGIRLDEVWYPVCPLFFTSCGSFLKH